MARFLVDVPEDDVRRLDELARREGKSRTGVIREAVANHIAASSKDWLEEGFGLWAKHGFTEDGMDYQNRFREEWVRDWDSQSDPDLHDPASDAKDAAE